MIVTTVEVLFGGRLVSGKLLCFCYLDLSNSQDDSFLKLFLHMVCFKNFEDK